jgi:hypothetical protein
MRSASFRNVALGILALVAAYSLGFQRASAQSQLFKVLNPSTPLCISTGGQIYLFDAEHGGWRVPSTVPPVSSSSLLVGDSGTYLTEDGTVWYWNANVWTSYPLPGSPTPVVRQSLGQLKVRYR